MFHGILAQLPHTTAHIASALRRDETSDGLLNTSCVASGHAAFSSSASLASSFDSGYFCCSQVSTRCSISFPKSG